MYGDTSYEECMKLTIFKLNQLKDNFKVRSDTAKLFPNLTPSEMPENPQECIKIMGETINERLGQFNQDEPIIMNDKNSNDFKKFK